MGLIMMWLGLTALLFLGVMAISEWRELDIEPARAAIGSVVGGIIFLLVLANSKKFR